MTTKFSIAKIVAALCVLQIAASGWGQMAPPNPLTIDFPQALCEMVNLPFIYDFILTSTTSPLDRQNACFLKHLDPDICDVNGPTSITVTPAGKLVTASMSGNGIPDAANELALLQRMLNDPDFDNGVLTHAQVVAAWEANWNKLLGDHIGADVVQLMVTLMGGRDILFVMNAYATLGDGSCGVSTDGDGNTVYSGEGSFGVLSVLLLWVNASMASAGFPGVALLNPVLDKSDPEWRFLRQLAALGDADGDGACNLAEFEQCTPNVTSCPTPELDPFTNIECPELDTPGEGEGDAISGPPYTDTALNPAVVPPSCAMYVPVPAITGPVSAGEHSRVVLGVDLEGAKGSAPVGYQWFFNGEALPGETFSTLEYWHVSRESAGTYRVMVITDDYATYSTNFTLHVYGTMPVSSGTGYAVTLLAMAAAGVFRLRRHRRS